MEESESVHFGDTSDEDLFPDSPQSPALVMLPQSRPPAPKAPPPASSSKDAAADRQKGKQGDGQNVKLSEEQRKRQDSDLSVLSGTSGKSSGSGGPSSGQFAERKGDDKQSMSG